MRANHDIQWTRVLPCLCGGSVRADRRWPTKGVADHNRSRLHQEWREARELDAPQPSRGANVSPSATLADTRRPARGLIPLGRPAA